MARRRKIKLSWMYILFVVTCVVALITPLLWERAYPQEPTVVIQHATINSSVVALKSLDHLEGYAQLGVASGTWFSGLPVSELFNTSVYEPEKSSSRSSSSDPLVSASPFDSDLFYAGDVLSANATLPGFKHTGGCEVIPDLGGLDAQNITGAFNAMCLDKLPGTLGGGPFIAHVGPGISFNITACSLKDWGEFLNGNQANSTNEAYFYFNTTYGYASEISNSTVGFVHCKSVTTTGNAQVSGLSGTYHDFREEVSPASTGQGAEPGCDPLFLLRYYLKDSYPLPTDRGILRGLGFVQDNDAETFRFHELSNEEIAQGLWRYVQHAVFATVTLHREEMTFPATIPIVVSAFNRDATYAAGAYAMLALWLVLVLGLTVVGFRKTFGDAFDGYVLTKMVLERQDLVGRGTPIANSARNDKLDAPFDYRTL